MKRVICYLREALRLMKGIPLRVLFTKQGHSRCYLGVIYNSFWMWRYTHRLGADLHYWNELTQKGDRST